MRCLAREVRSQAPAYLKAEAGYCLRMYFARLTGTAKGIREAVRRTGSKRQISQS
jgi:hypothetical protein